MGKPRGKDTRENHRCFDPRGGFATKESIGTGDGLVLCVLGLFCGWRQCLAIFGMALVLSAILSIILLICRKAGRKTELPFLPSLFGGYVLYYLW